MSWSRRLRVVVVSCRSPSWEAAASSSSRCLENRVEGLTNDVEHRSERQDAGGADGRRGALAVLNARQLNHDAAITLDGDLRLLDLAEVLDPAPHDVDRFVEDLGSSLCPRER